MPKGYDLSKKSDMRKFEQNFQKTVKSEAAKSLKNQKFDVTCPHCQASVKVPAGKSKCPKCGKEIDLELDITFK